MFRKDCTTVTGRLLSVNLFLGDSIIKVGTDIGYSKEVYGSFNAILEIGQKQYEEFVDTWPTRCRKLVF